MSKIVICLLFASALAAEVTYRDVHPLLQQHCSGCHSRGEIGPMPLTSYREARPWARAIREAVVRKTMPPWHADPAASVHFSNSRALSEEERKKIIAWVEGGAREGATVAPLLARQRESGWRFGKPDLVIRIPGFRVPPTGAVEYTFLVTPTSFADERWISAAEWKIDQRSMVHHINAFVRPQGSSYVKRAPAGEFYVATREDRAARREDEREVQRRELLLGYEPGYLPTAWGPRAAKLLPKNADLVFEMHYNTNGKAAVDYSELGLYFAKTPPAERVLTITPADSQLAIPPGDGNYRSATAATLTADATLVSLQPHMHLRGKAYEIVAAFPDGRKQSLLRVPKYDFRWQTTYFLAEPMKLPKGTRLEYTAWFDNSVNNPANPNPRDTVHWGDQSWEEMNIGFTEIAIKATQDPEVAKLEGTTRPAPRH